MYLEKRKMTNEEETNLISQMKFRLLEVNRLKGKVKWHLDRKTSLLDRMINMLNDKGI